MRALVAIVLLAAVAGGCRPPAERAAGPLPGALAFEAALARRLARAARQRDAETPPRTLHLGPDGAPRYTNRLILETSPYLLQHAHNPVDWRPWGDEAFATARREGRPVLLSIGYSTCHWCHVMEEESYEDLEIAEFLNAHFVAIKVDREERPDVDAVYLEAVQAVTGAVAGAHTSAPGHRCRRPSSAIPAARATRTRSPWRRRRSSAWPRAASTTSSAAASTATRPTPSGACRTSRRCSTTTHSSPGSTSRPSRRPGARSSPAWRARRSTTSRAR